MKILLAFFVRYLLAPLLVVVTLFVLNSIKKIKQALSMKKAVIFVLLTALVVALPSLFGFLRNEFVWSGLFLTILCYILLGCIFWKCSQTNMFNAIGIKDSIAGILLILFISTVMGAWIYYLVFAWISRLPYASWCMLNVLWFITPYIVMLNRKQFLDIPHPIYDPWILGEGAFDRSYWDNVDSFGSKSVRVKIYRKIGDRTYASLVVRLPDGISLGNWFNWFVEDQNRRFPQNPIEIQKRNSEVGWIFYTSRWFNVPFLIRILDSKKTSGENKIKNNRTIYIRRVQIITKAE